MRHLPKWAGGAGLSQLADGNQRSLAYRVDLFRKTEALGTGQSVQSVTLANSTFKLTCRRAHLGSNCLMLEFKARARIDRDYRGSSERQNVGNNRKRSYSI